MQINAATNVDGMLRQMSGTAFTGRSLGEAVDVFAEMVDQKAWIVLTLSGALTMAGLRGLILEMMERGWVHAIVSTGALVGHGMVEDLGLPHYKADPQIQDEVYLKHRLNRVYDVLEPEDNLDLLESKVRAVFDRLADASDGTPVGSCRLLEQLGNALPGQGVLQMAASKNIPIFIPAFTDSELGLDFAVHAQMRHRDQQQALRYDGFEDLLQFAERCELQAQARRPLGIFTLGGGVPRNWAQQVGPYVDVRDQRLGRPRRERLRFRYGVRICPDPVHYGHLSGCTYSEGVSWGKFVPKAEGGRYAEVLLDATVGWPLILRALIDRQQR